MEAIIETGGKQIHVKIGDVIFTEKLNLNEDDTVVFDKVLYLQTNTTYVGVPYLDNVIVEGKILKQGKAKKIVVFKMKPKKNYRKKMGHRQLYTKVEITKIETV